MARDGRVVQLVDGGAEAVVAAVMGGATAGYRVLSARLADPDDDAAGIVELLPPGGLLPPGPRTRANVGLEPTPGGAGDPDMVPGRGLFAPPERFDQRPFSAADAARTVTETTVETLRARGEPARYERILGEVLVGLDRAGPAPPAGRRDAPGPVAPGDRSREPSRRAGRAPGDHRPRHHRRRCIRAGAARPPRPTRRLDRRRGPGAAPRLGPRPEPGSGRRTPRTDPRRVDPSDAAARGGDRTRPLVAGRARGSRRRRGAARRSRRVGGLQPAVDGRPISEAAFYERIASLFTGHDLPDEGLVRACLDSYRSLASTPDGLITGDDLLRRSQEHTELLALLADAGHRLGMRVWIGRQEQTRRTPEGLLVDRLDAREQRAYLGGISRAGEDLAEVDAIWYIRGKVALLFEVEWTAMLGEPILRRHARIPPDESIIRFLVIAPERAELVRYKLERSPLLRAALDEGTWHIVKSDHLRAFLARDPLDLADLEPYLGLDPLIERTGEQMPLFGG